MLWRRTWGSQRVLRTGLVISVLLCGACTREQPPVAEGAGDEPLSDDAALEMEAIAAEIELIPAPEPLAEPPRPKINTADHKAGFEEIDWVMLIPEADLAVLENPPEYYAQIEDGSVADQLGSDGGAASMSSTEARYQQALVSTTIRPEFNERKIRIPGFIVPLEFDDQQTVTTFFLVPYFGACIHMPPPPPNQIIYVEFEPGIQLTSIDDPFWVSGTLFTTLTENDMATAAYSVSAASITPYFVD